MFSLRLTCSPDQVDLLSAELWELQTAGIRELDSEEQTVLIAGFEADDRQVELLNQFASYAPNWTEEPDIDWVQTTKDRWPGREVGAKIFLAPVWSSAETPAGRIRITHNPGLASGTGEHPCTQLALTALERLQLNGARVLDIGTGSGILAIAALHLGAKQAVGLDTDAQALESARENFRLNDLSPCLVAGTTNALSTACADLTIANISGTILLSIFDDLLRITSQDGRLVLTGFDKGELEFFLRLLPGSEVLAFDDWRCLLATVSSSSNEPKPA